MARIDGLAHIPFSFTNRHEVRLSGYSTTSLSNRLSTSIRRSTITNTLNWNYNKSSENSTAAVNGNLLLGARVWDVLVRGRLGYEVRPIANLNSAAISADWRINKDYNAQWSVDSSLIEGGKTTYSASINTRFKQVSLGFKVQYRHRE